MTYFRIQQADRDATELLDQSDWLSFNWNQRTRDCRGCVDCEPSKADRCELGQTCGGSFEVEDARYGVSVCRSLEDLAGYAAHVGMDLWSVPMVIVELNGPESTDKPDDAHLGEVLLLPNEIEGTQDVTDEFIESVFALRDDAGIE